MRRMYSQNELISLIEEYGGHITPEDIQEMFDEGNVSLKGLYVQIISAPTSTTLTADEVEYFKEGVFIEGNFLNLHNPVVFPARLHEGSNTLRGGIIGDNQYGQLEICVYTIDSSNEISIARPIFLNTTGQVGILNLYSVNGFAYPIAGSQNNVTSGDTIDLTSTLGKALLAHLDVEINGHKCRFESEEDSGGSTYVIYSSFGEVSASGKLTANIISYNKSNGEISFNQMTFTPDV